MPLSSTSRVVPAPLVIPDCCNIGVVLRTVIALNAASLVASLVQAPDLRAGCLAFFDSSLLIELACLWSLFLLCALRRGLQRRPVPPAFPVQRALCVIVPAAVTAALAAGLAGTSWLYSNDRWHTVLGATLAAALAGMAAQHYFELRARAYSPTLVEARLQALQARIRPHFLFNSLNAVLSLIRNEPRRAESALEDLAELFRVLMSDPRSMTTLDEELRLCRQYLSIEQIRLGARMRVEWDMGEADDAFLSQVRVPVLLIQPLLENAVHYGVEPAVEPVTVRIQVGRAGDRLQVLVLNPYHGEHAGPAGNQIALRNIRERLELLYDLEAELKTAVNQDCFEARLRLPYAKGMA
ncbi:sensor histidine kinase [Noviherbaspirillum galbum]|uniref:Histidine kinase n=1 Tax=Noviherbaspirillum galbum TaxID=2709383 RepID=A0A6B3SQG3_9BURK|nr:histidine kinase [Noviherbaspirillum galbum]NEX61545.1 histidine kinase [Noviherbaspirillum galbum]